MKRLIVVAAVLALALQMAGAQWVEVPLTRPQPEGSYVWESIYFADTLNGWVVSDNQNWFARTRDGGRTWQPQFIPLPTGPTGFGGVYFADTLRGLIAGKSGYGNGPGVIIRTSDGGQTWQQVAHPAVNSQWEEVVLVGDSLWVIGSYWSDSRSKHALMLRAPLAALFSPSPIPWRFYEYPQFRGFSEVCVVSPNLVWIGGGGWNDTTGTWQSSLVHTTDGGQTFVNDAHKVATGTRLIMDIVFADTDRGWLSVNDKVYATVNAGETWLQQSAWEASPQLVPDAGLELFAGNMSVATLTARIYKTTDGGNSWVQIAQGQVSGGIRDFFSRDGKFWAIGSNAIWYYQYTPNHLPVLEVAYDTVAYAGTPYKVPYRAYDTDPGDWAKVTLDYRVTPRFLTVDSANSRLAGSVPIPMIGSTFRFRVVATDTHGDSSSFTSKLISVDKASKVEDEASIPSEFSLSQNYPNPFNPSTTIDFEIPVTGHVSLEIYDLLGREVERLKDEVLTPGSYSTQWTPRTSPSGVYFYRLVAGRHAETKQMLLVR